MYDLVIRNARIADGTGRPVFTGDVAVQGDRIAAVGGKLGPGRREIAADGRLLAPGWIDVHTHYDGQATWDPLLGPSCWHGVTTLVMGNCGVGFAPVRPADHDRLIEMMEGVEDIPGTALHEGLTWGWESFPEYLDTLAGMPHAVDIGVQVPHNPVRSYVMGDRASSDTEAATADEIAEMQRIVIEGLKAGALGVTTSRTKFHRTSKGEHVPSRFAAEQELFALAGALRQHGQGVYGMLCDFDDPEAEVAMIRRLSVAAGKPVYYLLVQMDHVPDTWSRVLSMSGPGSDGATLIPQVSSRPVGFLLSLEATLHPFISRKSYKAIAHLPLGERLQAMRNPEIRAQILAETREHRSPLLREVTQTGFHKMFRLGDPPNYEPAPEESVQAIADREGRSAQEVAYDILLEREGKEFLCMFFTNYLHKDHEVTLQMMEHEGAVLGVGDGGAHCGLICDASMPTFLLTHWVRDRTRGRRVPLEWAVKRHTLDNARLFGLGDRGAILPGMKADLNLIDDAGLRLHPPQMIYDLPAGGRRLIQRVDGYAATILSGQVTFEESEGTGTLPGRLIRGQQTGPKAA